MSDEVIKPPVATIPALSYFNFINGVKFNGSFLNQDKVTLKHGTIVNIYIGYDLDLTLNNFDFALKNCLFGAVKLTKNSDIDK